MSHDDSSLWVTVWPWNAPFCHGCHGAINMCHTYSVYSYIPSRFSKPRPWKWQLQQGITKWTQVHIPKGYGISGGDQSGWAPPADLSASQTLNNINTTNDIGQFSNSADAKSAFKRVRRNTDPTSVLGTPIKFPSKDPICKFGLPSADFKILGTYFHF